VDGSKSPLQMLQEDCSRFRAEEEAIANRDFGRTILEFSVHAASRNECQPDPSKDDSEGDDQCKTWFKENNHFTIQHMTVPRCVTTQRGVRKCQLRAKEGINCPLYKDKNGTEVERQDLPIGGGLSSVKITEGPYEYDCDRHLGLKCETLSSPFMVLGVPLLKGSSRCVRR
jgi:hypothetical protein